MSKATKTVSDDREGRGKARETFGKGVAENGTRDLERALAEDRTCREAAAIERLNALCKELRVRVVPVFQIVGQQVESRIQIVAE